MMWSTKGIAAPVVHAATAHLLPTAVVVTGTLLLLKVVVAKSWYTRHQQRKTTEDRQAELEQQLTALQEQYASLAASQQPVQASEPKTVSGSQRKYVPGETASGKSSLFNQIINENIAIREAANA